MSKSLKIRWARISIALSIIMLMVFLFSGNGIAANVITANLNITPSANVSPGTQLNFKGSIFNNPAFSHPPGTRLRCWVVQPDFTRVTEPVDIDYPLPGQLVTIAFTDKFTIPSNAKHGKLYNFYLVYGIYYPISAKSSVTVTIKKLQISQNKVLIPITKKPKIVVKNFAYSPAPLKEGAHINMYIVFENKGLGKSDINAKYQIRCDILQGGGPLKKCPVPSTERAFGKVILPGQTHSASLLCATPAEARQYKISIIISGATGRPYSVMLNVAKKTNSKFQKTLPEPPRKVKQ
ncbi:MAG: hypothetical protein K8R67_00160 [Desulfobacteraceae bacterium]|nr:hypothetical protein [Desulfobacteraceae bacterium]